MRPTLAKAWPDRPEDALLCALLALSLAVALLAGGEARFHDEHEYLGLARNLVAHGTLSADGTTPTAFRPPVWPLLLAGMQALTPLLWPAKLFNLACLALAAWISARIVRRLGAPPVAALGVALMVYFEPYGFGTATTLYPQAFCSLVVAASLGLCLVPGLAAAAGLGALAGIGTLTAPGLALVLPPLALAQVRLAPGPALPRLVAAALGCLVVMAPWTARNAIQFGALVPLSTSGGLNLLKGNSAKTTPTSGVNVDIQAELAVASAMAEVAGDRYLRDRATGWIRENPLDAATLYLGKLANWFALSNAIYTDGEEGAGTARLVVGAVGAGGLFLAALLGVFLWPGPATVPRLLCAFYLLAGLAHAIVFTRIRFRVPFDPVLAILAWPFLAEVWARLARRSLRAA